MLRSWERTEESPGNSELTVFRWRFPATMYHDPIWPQYFGFHLVEITSSSRGIVSGTIADIRITTVLLGN